MTRLGEGISHAFQHRLVPLSPLAKEVIEARDAKNEARQREILDEFYLKGEE